MLGQHELDQLLSEWEKLNEDIQAILNQQTDQWGIIHADSEYEAAQRLANQLASMQLRYLQTITEIAGGKSSTIVFPLPVKT